MADYFLALEAELFERRLRPALAESRRRRSFEPARRLCVDLLPAARTYARRFHVADEPLPAAVAAGLPFDRAVWRALAGELLLYAAAEIPELQTAEETLTRLLAAGVDGDADAPPERWSPIRQAHHGSRYLTFGTATYRPGHAAFNALDDVSRLAAYLAGQRPETWTVDDLAGDAADRADELEHVREWFPALADLYRRCAERERVLVIETIY